MEIKDAASLVEGFPPGYIFVAFIAGFMTIMFSPFSLLFPNWISNPFFATNQQLLPTEALSRLSIIAVTSFAFGVPLSLLEGPITTSGGINEKAVKILRRIARKTPKKTEEKPNLQDPKAKEKPNLQDPKNLPIHKFLVWLKETGFMRYHNYLVLKNAIVNGLIVGSEIAVVLNIFWLPFQRILGYDMTTYAIMLSVSSSVFLASYLFNKWWWKETIKCQVEKLWKEFDEADREAHKKVNPEHYG